MKSVNEDHSGLKRLLGFASFYNLFQKHALGGNEARKWLAANFWKVKSGDRVIDFGCGSGTILEHLPREISYIGVDISENYIRSARESFSSRGTFMVGTPQELVKSDPSLLNSADIVICNGLLHHLPDDEALEVLHLSRRVLKLQGRLVSLEAAFLSRQTRISKWFVSLDRGRHIRFEQEWKDLISQVFDQYSTTVLTGLIRIPYTHIVIECVREN